MEYITDQEAVERAIAIASEGGICISHGTARTIASWYAERSNYAFVSTGHVYDHPDVMMMDFIAGTEHEGQGADGSPELTALYEYLIERCAQGLPQPVPGWSSMWVDKSDSNFPERY